MPLVDRVRIARRFQRAVRIDTDVGTPLALEGFVCPKSSAEVLRVMARHVADVEQGAFTWTGPFGSGKSSLAIVLSALLNGKEQIRSYAASIVGRETAETVWKGLPPRSKGWRILPVVGRRGNAVQVVGEALTAAGYVPASSTEQWDDTRTLECLQGVAAQFPRAGGGLLVFIDEMGKFLEAAAYDGSDIFFFQQLAEIASRSAGRLILVGILHQAFEEYAHRLSRENRDEWSKIQGRFVDLAVNVAGDEQIDLVSRAIESDHAPEKPGALAQGVASIMRAGTAPGMAQMLEDCWPLHPAVGCLLGPMSRRRFGQNQRSIFGFLNSTEPKGFQDFLRNAADGDLYPVDLFWDYLRANLEPSIMASPDGHRWALTVDALERCDASGGDELQVRLLKCIGLLDLLKDRSGLAAGGKLLELASPGYSSRKIHQALATLQEKSLIIFRKFNAAYSVFEGSDFDIDRAVEQALVDVDVADLPRLNALAAIQPLVAKRHYHKTGALRWFDVRVVPLTELEHAASETLQNGAVGAFLLALPSRGEDQSTAEDICLRAVNRDGTADVVVGLPREAWDLSWLGRELLALETVRAETIELQGDRVARNEVDARISDTQGRIEATLNRAFGHAVWYRKDARPKTLSRPELNGLASELADARFQHTPRLLNELLNRTKPSSNAVAAQKALLRQMVLHEGRERLGIEGFPPEGGLFDSLLAATGLYRDTTRGWLFARPDSEDDPCRLAPAWNAATDYLRSNPHRTVCVTEIYDIWREAPFGIKDGLMPVLLVAFVLADHSDLAFYRQGIFQASMSDLDMDYLANDPNHIQVRWMNLPAASRRMLSDMADVVRELDKENRLADLEPIDVAKGLVAIYDRLAPWVGHTQRLTANAKRLRQLLKQASDPNKLIFDDIPHVLGDDSEVSEAALERVAGHMRNGLAELQQAYPSMLNRLRETLLTELEVPNASAPMLTELRERATNVRQLSGDHRLEAFVVRLTQFHGSDEDMESLAGMATNKPLRNWVDADVDKAALELAALAQQFIRVENFAHVRGRPDKRHAMAVVVGMRGRPEAFHGQFEIMETERQEVEALIADIAKTLNQQGEHRRHIILTALAELSARYLRDATRDKLADKPRERKEAS